jgi:hypothetical protein
MKIMALGLAIASMSVALPACASYGHGQYAYDAYYDDAYGPYYDGYWGDDGLFWYRNRSGHYIRDDGHHFQHGPGGGGFHGVHSGGGGFHGGGGGFHGGGGGGHGGRG